MELQSCMHLSLGSTGESCLPPPETGTAYLKVFTLNLGPQCTIIVFI